MDDAVVEEIKARIDIADLIASYGIQVKHAGGSAKACCPFHNEKTPSFHIQPSKGFYHCFGCGESGDAISFVRKMDGLTFPEAVKKLADQLGIKYEEGKKDPEAGRRKRLLALMAELAQFYHRCLLKIKEAESAREYLKKRALDGETAENWLIGYAPNGIAVIMKWAEKYGFTAEELEAAGVIKGPNRPGDRGYHRFGGRLMFSIRDKQGRVVAFSGRQLVEQKNSGKYVNSPETMIFKKSNVLFGFDKAAGNIAKAPHREAIVCEGQIDTIRLHLSGFPVAVASQGTAFTEEHAKMLKRVADQVTLVFDDDAAGHKATIRTAAILLREELPVRTVSLPGGDDPDSFLRSHPAADFRKLLDGAESIVSFQCRVEKAKETNPGSIDAVARISKAVLNTIAHCKSAILKAQMIHEAAKLLSLPAAALNEELAKVKVEKPKVEVKAEIEEEEADEAPGSGAERRERTASVQQQAGTAERPEPGADAGAVAPPDRLENDLMAFLLDNERDATLGAMLGEFLPREVFDHEFTLRFLDNWKLELKSSDDVFATFAASLDPVARDWFDSVLAATGKARTGLGSPTDILQDYIRRLWMRRLTRLRGELPVASDAATLMKRMRLTTDIKRLNMIKWSELKDFIREQSHGKQGTGTEHQG